MSLRKDLRAFVRLDGAGRKISGTLIYRKSMPKVGRWVEVAANECCNPTCNTYVANGSLSGAVTLTYVDCDLVAHTEVLDDASDFYFCARSYTISEPGTVTLYQSGYCVPDPRN